MSFLKLDKTSAIVGVVLTIILAVTSSKYYGATDPLSNSEIDVYMKNIRHMFMTVGVPDGNGKGDLEQFMQEFRDFAEADDGKPIYMVNMMKWRDKPIVREGLEFNGTTSLDADIIYNQKLFWELLNNYSHTAYLSSALPNAFTYGLYSGEANNWDEIGIFRYSSRRDFFNMVASESYRGVVYFKLASMGVITITPTQTHGLVFNPMPNIPVLMFFIFIIGFLMFLLTRRTT